jgi:hypothetical protein
MSHARDIASLVLWVDVIELKHNRIWLAAIYAMMRQKKVVQPRNNCSPDFQSTQPYDRFVPNRVVGISSCVIHFSASVAVCLESIRSGRPSSEGTRACASRTRFWHAES